MATSGASGVARIVGPNATRAPRLPPGSLRRRCTATATALLRRACSRAAPSPSAAPSTPRAACAARSARRLRRSWSTPPMRPRALAGRALGRVDVLVCDARTAWDAADGGEAGLRAGADGAFLAVRAVAVAGWIPAEGAPAPGPGGKVVADRPGPGAGPARGRPARGAREPGPHPLHGVGALRRHALRGAARRRERARGRRGAVRLPGLRGRATTSRDRVHPRRQLASAPLSSAVRRSRRRRVSGGRAAGARPPRAGRPPSTARWRSHERPAAVQRRRGRRRARRAAPARPPRPRRSRSVALLLRALDELLQGLERALALRAHGREVNASPMTCPKTRSATWAEAVACSTSSSASQALGRAAARTAIRSANPRKRSATSASMQVDLRGEAAVDRRDADPGAALRPAGGSRRRRARRTRRRRRRARARGCGAASARMVRGRSPWGRTVADGWGASPLETEPPRSVRMPRQPEISLPLLAPYPEIRMSPTYLSLDAFYAADPRRAALARDRHRPVVEWPRQPRADLPRGLGAGDGRALRHAARGDARRRAGRRPGRRSTTRPARASGSPGWQGVCGEEGSLRWLLEHADRVPLAPAARRAAARGPAPAAPGSVRSAGSRSAPRDRQARRRHAHAHAAPAARGLRRRSASGWSSSSPGRDKLLEHAMATAHFAAWGFPLPGVTVASPGVVELGGGLLLMAGLGVRGACARPRGRDGDRRGCSPALTPATSSSWSRRSCARLRAARPSAGRAAAATAAGEA